MHAIYLYANVAKDVAPKRARLKEAQVRSRSNANPNLDCNLSPVQGNLYRDFVLQVLSGWCIPALVGVVCELGLEDVLLHSPRSTLLNVDKFNEIR